MTVCIYRYIHTAALTQRGCHTLRRSYVTRTTWKLLGQPPRQCFFLQVDLFENCYQCEPINCTALLLFINLSVKYGLPLPTGALILLTESIHLTTHMLGEIEARSFTRHLSYKIRNLYIKTISYTVGKRPNNVKAGFNPLAPEIYFFLILAHTVYKTWIIQEPNKLGLWNILHFEEKRT